MSKPSDHFISDLIRLIMECPSETGKGLISFLTDSYNDQTSDMSEIDLIAKLKEMQNG